MGKYYDSGKLPSNTAAARASNSKRNPNGFLYCFYIEEIGLVKIGVSVDVNRRHKEVDSNSPYKVINLFSFYFDKVYNMEECVHDSFEHLRFRKEWFKLTKSEIAQLYLDLKQWSEEGLVLTKRRKDLWDESTIQTTKSSVSRKK